MIVFFSARISPFTSTVILRDKIPLGHGGGHFGDVAHLGRQVRGHRIHRVGQILPRAGHARHRGLPAQLAFGTDFAGHASHFAGEGVELIDHRVERVLQFENFALDVDRDLLRQVAVGHGGGHVGDVADLARQVRGHRVDVVGQIFPGAGHARHLRLAAQLAFGAHFAGHAAHFAGEGVELVDHRVDGVLQLENFAAHGHGDFFRQVAVGHGGGHLGDVAHLRGEVGRHRVDRVGQVLPGAGHAAHFGLTAQFAFGADFAGHAGHFRGKAVELIDHRVDGVLQFENLAAHVDGDFLRQVAVGHGGGDFGDVAHLAGEVRGHEVDVVGQILPGAGHARHRGLPAELALGADFAGHAGHFRGEAVELIEHRVDRVLQREDFALHVDGDLARQVALGHGGGHFGDVADLGRQVRGHRIHRVGQVLPRAGHARHRGLPAQLAFGADFAGHARHLGGKTVELIDHRVDGFLQLQDFALHVDGDLAREIAAGHRRRHRRDVADLGRKIRGHGIDRVGQVFPGSADARHHGLAAESAFGADFAGHARHFRRERPELVDHRIDGLLELQDFAAHVDRDLLRKVAVGHGDRHVGDVAHLGGEIARHLVDRLGQVFPDARHAAHLRLAAELAFGADFAGHARHFRGEDRELLDHRIDQLGRPQELALQRAPVHFQFHRLAQVPLGHGTDGAGDIRSRPHQVVQAAY